MWCTKKVQSLTGQIFLLVECEGKTITCSDRAGAGSGDRVLVARGSAARCGLGAEIPVDAAIVGIVDRVDPPN